MRYISTLLETERKYLTLRCFIQSGGYAWSGISSNAALRMPPAKTFVSRASIPIFQQYKRRFDGIDIAGTSGSRRPGQRSPEDKHNFTCCWQNLRHELMTWALDGTHYLLTIAAAGGPAWISTMNATRSPNTSTGST